MSKKYKINVEGNETTLNDSNRNNVIKNTINNSVTKNNNKIIPKSKNANKKQKNDRNILLPQEEPTVENGGFKNIIDENFYNLRKKPEIYDISFMRPNLQLLYNENRSIQMYAYVTAHRNKDNKYVLYNLCSEMLFLSDHVIVKPDEKDVLAYKINQCITFIGKPIRYGDKYSVIVSEVQYIGFSEPPKLNYLDNCPDKNDVDDVFIFLSELDPIKKYEIIKYLVTKLEGYSLQLFRNKKFIIAMICDFYFMRTINNDLSNNKFFNVLDRTKERFIMLFCDILYGIEIGKLTGFKEIQNRILLICMTIQGFPEKNVVKTNNLEFISFLKDYFIDYDHAIKYIKDIYKWYDIKGIQRINSYTLNNEMRYAVASIIMNS